MAFEFQIQSRVEKPRIDCVLFACRVRVRRFTRARLFFSRIIYIRRVFDFRRVDTPTEPHMTGPVFSKIDGVNGVENGR